MAPGRKLDTESDDFSSARGDYPAQASKRMRFYMEEEEEEDPEEILEEVEEDPEELPEEEEEPHNEELLFEEVEKEIAQEAKEEEKEFEKEEEDPEEEEESVVKKGDQGHQYKLDSEANEIPESCGSVKEKMWSRRAGCGRLWNEDDEITILTGMIDFRYMRGGMCACDDLGAFYDFIKDNLQFNASKQQLTGKVKRLKRKYLGNKVKTANMAKANGELHSVFTTRHEERVFLLSNQIWAKEDDDDRDDVDADDDDANNNEGSMQTVNNEKGATNYHDGNSAEEKEKKGVEEQKFWSTYPRLHESLKLGQFTEYTLPGCGAWFIKQTLSSIGRSKAEELENKWRKLHKAEIEVKLMRAQLIQEQTQLILNLM